MSKKEIVEENLPLYRAVEFAEGLKDRKDKLIASVLRRKYSDKATIDTWNKRLKNLKEQKV